MSTGDSRYFGLITEGTTIPEIGIHQILACTEEDLEVCSLTTTICSYHVSRTLLHSVKERGPVGSSYVCSNARNMERQIPFISFPLQLIETNQRALRRKLAAGEVEAVKAPDNTVMLEVDELTSEVGLTEH